MSGMSDEDNKQLDVSPSGKSPDPYQASMARNRAAHRAAFIAFPFSYRLFLYQHRTTRYT